MKNWQKNILTLCVSLLLTLLVAEGILRFFPVNEGLRSQAVNEKNPVFHFQPNRTSTWSRFPDFSMINEVHSNNYGFLNNQDYNPKGKKPLIAVIGDSYVEAAMVPYRNTLHGRLATALQESDRVYSFAASGAPLSQYLAWARFVKEEFQAKKMIFVIIANDYDESLTEYKFSDGFHFFRSTEEGALELVRKDFIRSLPGHIIPHSSLAMYLLVNCRLYDPIVNMLHNPVGTIKNYFTQKENRVYIGQTDVHVNEKRIQLSRKAVDKFFELLPEYTGLTNQDILFVIDGLRPHLYTEEDNQTVQNSYAALMNSYFMTHAQKKGYPVINMDPVFRTDYEQNKKKFEYPRDGHWNDYGHELVFRELLRHYQP